MASWQRRLRLERLEHSSPEERRALAVAKLCEAKLTLSTAQTCFEQAVAESATDIAGLTFDRGEEKLNTFAATLRHMHAAHALATEAAEAIQLNADMGTPIALEDKSLLMALDTAWLSDGLMTDLAMHSAIQTAGGHLGAMRHGVDALLSAIQRTRSSPRTDAGA